MAFRIQSPSSINTYKQCPRKYFYQYITKLKTSPSIHTIRGNIVHSVLEDFFDVDTKDLTYDNCEPVLTQKIQELLVHHWNEKKEALQNLGLEEKELHFYFEESMMMLINWLQKFLTKARKINNEDFKIIFKQLTPLRELQYRSEEKAVRGFIDAIEVLKGKVRLMDYKSSKKFDISNAYKLQLAIYAMLYEEKHNKKPDQVGIYFLKDTGKHEYTMDVDEKLIQFAKLEVEMIHLNTESNTIADYPKNITPLCKWRTGQCDFYGLCFEQKELHEFR
ncbi:MAG: RecB family exonuclease [Candidatus Nanoarchaeia archaeon]